MGYTVFPYNSHVKVRFSYVAVFGTGCSKTSLWSNEIKLWALGLKGGAAFRSTFCSSRGPGLVPGTHIRWLMTVSNSSSRGDGALCADTHMQTLTSTELKTV